MILILEFVLVACHYRPAHGSTPPPQHGAPRGLGWQPRVGATQRTRARSLQTTPSLHDYSRPCLDRAAGASRGYLLLSPAGVPPMGMAAASGGTVGTAAVCSVRNPIHRLSVSGASTRHPEPCALLLSTLTTVLSACSCRRCNSLGERSAWRAPLQAAD